MTRFIAFNFWILSKVIYWLSIFFVVLETNPVTAARQYLFVKVAIDARQCERDVRWDLIQQLVYANLKNSSQLGLSGAGRYCGCNNGTPQPVCNGTSNKTAVNLLYETSTGKVNTNAGQLATAERQLSYTDRVVSQVTIPTYYICSSLTVITETDAEYKYCNPSNPSGTSFTNHISPSGSAPSGKPGTATIVGAVVGSLAGLGLLAALARVIYGVVKKANQVDDSGSTSDIVPIIPGFNGIVEAPNSVPPAGTH